MRLLDASFNMAFGTPCPRPLAFRWVCMYTPALPYQGCVHLPTRVSSCNLSLFRHAYFASMCCKQSPFVLQQGKPSPRDFFYLIDFSWFSRCFPFCFVRDLTASLDGFRNRIIFVIQFFKREQWRIELAKMIRDLEVLLGLATLPRIR